MVPIPTLRTEWQAHRFEQVMFHCLDCDHAFLMAKAEIVRKVGWNATASIVRQAIPCIACGRHSTEVSLIFNHRENMMRMGMKEPPTLNDFESEGRKLLSIVCTGICGHHSKTTPRELAGRFGWDATVFHMNGRFKCSKCGNKGGRIQLAGPDIR